MKLMSLRSRRVSLISSYSAALVKFFLLKNASIVSVKAPNQSSCLSKSAQSLAVIFFVAFLLSAKHHNVDTAQCFFPGIRGIFFVACFYLADNVYVKLINEFGFTHRDGFLCVGQKF